MPIYEYVCRNCGDEIEKLQAMADAPLTDCGACGETALKRKVSAPGFRLAGGGWYETDFKQEGRRQIAGDGDKASGGNSDGGDAKGDSQGESKSNGNASGSGNKSSSQDKSTTAD